MGLYMNQFAHPDVFKNQENLEAPNQDYFKEDYAAEMVKAQQRINESLTNAHRELRTLFHQQQQTQVNERKSMENELAQLKASSRQYAQFKQYVMEGFHMLEETNEKLFERLEEEGLLQQEMIDEIKHIREANQTVLRQIADQESLNQELNAKMDDFLQLQQTMAESISQQHDDQQTTLDSLEKQDALMEKTFRQVTNLRSALFERTSFLAEKVENSYKLTSSFIYNVVSESDQPLAFRLDQKLAERKERK